MCQKYFREVLTGNSLCPTYVYTIMIFLEFKLFCLDVFFYKAVCWKHEVFSLPLDSIWGVKCLQRRTVFLWKMNNLPIIIICSSKLASSGLVCNTSGCFKNHSSLIHNDLINHMWYVFLILFFFNSWVLCFVS